MQCICVVIAVVLVHGSLAVGDDIDFRPGECLPGDKHKELASPEPEGPGYAACLQWREETCCTAEFTQQLAEATVTNIDGFHWNRCRDLSPSCQEFFVRVECFYRCSPHVAHWALLEFDSALANLPLCREFCDEWFDACSDDMTCAENWITDWLYIEGENYCRNTTDCRTYREVYEDGRGICETLWGQSFIYSSYSQNDNDRRCMTPWWPEDEANPNIAALENIFNRTIDHPYDGLGDNVEFRPGECLPGDKHKELASPEPEGPGYAACLQWREETCCTAEFTQQLEEATVTNIDGFHWNRCGDLSPSCQEFFVRVECFYRCSPHVAHWALLEFDSALANLPLCREFCDEWFDACSDDMTCAENWITDWLYIEGENYCRNTTDCRTYREVYEDGRGICETLWGQSFIYSSYSQNDNDRRCMTPWWPEDEANPNIAALENIFNRTIDHPYNESPGSPVAPLVSLLLLLLLLAV